MAASAHIPRDELIDGDNVQVNSVPISPRARSGKPLVTRIDVDRDGTLTLCAASAAGERIGSRASIRTGLYGAHLRRTDINGRR